MRHNRLVLFALTLAVPGCTHSGNPSVGGEPKSPTVKEHVFKESLTEAETRLNRYFAEVVSRTGLKDCLSRVQGEGLVAASFVKVQFPPDFM